MQKFPISPDGGEMGVGGSDGEPLATRAAPYIHCLQVCIKVGVSFPHPTQ